MPDTALAINQISKRYRLGAGPAGKGDFREAASSIFTGLRDRLSGKASPIKEEDRELWALRDISFEVPRGSVMGLIGHNGAGKSTLLKILSRITDPTSGTAWIDGRVGSLLEVGTGFHPELSGRENIFLNGAILGMTHREISAKFDQIVEFSEIGRFLDTPVKRYSSGMYVRLAFSVAAHLEPEIMIIDEVLAVGDAAFQRKCLEKIQEIARGGRTILFVSHNMASIQTLCDRAIVLDGGQLVGEGEPGWAVQTYLARNAPKGRDLADADHREGHGRPRVRGIEIYNDGQPEASGMLVFGQNANFVFRLSEPCPEVACIFAIYDTFGRPVARFTSKSPSLDDAHGDDPQSIVCHIPELSLSPGQYHVNVVLKTRDGLADVVNHASQFNIEQGMIGDRRPDSVQLECPVVLRHRWTFPAGSVARS